MIQELEGGEGDTAWLAPPGYREGVKKPDDHVDSSMWPLTPA